MTERVIGTWSRARGNIMIHLPAFRKVGGRRYPLKSKYLGDREDPVSPLHVEQDLKAEYHIDVKLVPTSPRGGKIVQRE